MKRALKRRFTVAHSAVKRVTGVQAKQQIKYQCPEEKQHSRLKHFRFFISS